MEKTRVQEEKGPPKVKQKLVEIGTQDFSLAFDLIADKKVYIRRVIGFFVSRVNSSVEAGAALRGTGNCHFVIQNRFQIGENKCWSVLVNVRSFQVMCGQSRSR